LKENDTTNQKLASSIFKLAQILNQEMKEKCLEDIRDEEKMKDVIRTRGNNHSPDMNQLTNPAIKLERESSATMFIELLKMQLAPGFAFNNGKQQGLSYFIKDEI
jgi:hypothetical protein